MAQLVGKDVMAQVASPLAPHAFRAIFGADMKLCCCKVGQRVMMTSQFKNKGMGTITQVKSPPDRDGSATSATDPASEATRCMLTAATVRCDGMTATRTARSSQDRRCCAAAG
eukprot:2742114-Rhodomonas_salina.1